MKILLIIGAINAFLSVALGAFGAHALEGRVEPKYLDTWNTAVQYQMFHATAILITGVLIGTLPASGLFGTAGWLFVGGIVFFSGSLYVLSLTGISVLGAITPIGGLLFLGGWVCLIIAIAKVL
ncbi:MULTISPECIES: DUF423 domain-containing protein [Jeotgalibacillus]|uniref:Membrane protein n=2 Tax=Jeotgalibacillus TaxID=157226 RepID=A0A0B5AQA8_9BACL|nr:MULTISPECIES: DUF423 domain-containing protein [Jeotgalibacillus]AJD92425.1 membrane protein [Jeotgalibacillus malaysiensis]MDZ5711158.1 DUF423 domain-containing protein [Jeotgalibacillus sp. HH7-29]